MTHDKQLATIENETNMCKTVATSEDPQKYACAKQSQYVYKDHRKYSDIHSKQHVRYVLVTRGVAKVDKECVEE